ncbi:MAG TPA: Gfo/Idh/MocA family oxidoreductase [Arenicellales bacterium]|jgi:predicted dehydrogenase|nr:Gfo/Idh/MocA family oxidoreductase [Arenicellales bacterium]
MNRSTLAIIGCGVIGRRHLKAIGAIEEAHLLAIVDPSPQVENIATDVGAAFYTSVEKMLHEVQPQGVIVSTPTEHHLQPVLEALKAGAQVLVEKPIAATLAQAQLILRAAEKASRHVLVGHHRRYYTITQKARQLVREGTLGELVGVNGQWTTRKADAYYAPTWRQQRSSGPVLINLIHEIDTLRYICGEIASISARVQRGIRDHPKEETVALVMAFQSGALGTFLLSDVAPSPWTWEQATGENPDFPLSGQNVYRFVGSERALDFPNLTLWHPDGVPDWNHPMRSESLHLELGDAFLAQCRHLCAVIQGEEAPRITAADAIRTLAATLAVFDSAQTEKQVIL